MRRLLSIGALALALVSLGLSGEVRAGAKVTPPQDPPTLEQQLAPPKVQPDPSLTPFNVDPSRLDPQLKALVAKYDIRFRPYRIVTGRGGVMLSNIRSDAVIYFVRVGTPLPICNVDAFYHKPIAQAHDQYRELGTIAPRQCLDFHPPAPGYYSLGCKIHSHEFYAVVVLPADHPMDEESIQILMLKLNGAQTGPYATFYAREAEPLPGVRADLGRLGPVPPAFAGWDRRLRIYMEECWAPPGALTPEPCPTAKTYTDHYSIGDKYLGIDRADYDRVRGELKASGLEFRWERETGREQESRFDKP